MRLQEAQLDDRLPGITSTGAEDMSLRVILTSYYHEHEMANIETRIEEMINNVFIIRVRELVQPINRTHSKIIEASS